MPLISISGIQDHIKVTQPCDRVCRQSCVLVKGLQWLTRERHFVASTRTQTVLVTAVIGVLVCSGLSYAANEEPQTDEEIFAEERTKLRNASPEFFALFEEKTLRYTGGGYEDEEFPYRLYSPQVEGDEKLPLLVWLHGAGEAGGNDKRGDDNISQLLWINKHVITPPYDRQRYPFFVLAVQCPRANRGWTTSNPEQDDMLNVVIAALEDTIEEQGVDSDRVSVVGISSGGEACWKLAARRPDLFAAIAPISCSCSETTQLEGLTEVSVWAFCSDRDAQVAVKDARRPVDAARELGGFAKLTVVNETAEYTNSSHDAWTEAFHVHDALHWLLNQRRGQSVSASEWNWWRHRFLNVDYLWPRAATLAGAMVLVLAVRQEVKRRRKKNGSPEPKAEIAVEV